MAFITLVIATLCAAVAGQVASPEAGLVDWALEKGAEVGELLLATGCLCAWSMLGVLGSHHHAAVVAGQRIRQ
jgi:hypothetical protein